MTRKTCKSITLILGCLLGCTALMAQQADPPTLEISGEVLTPLHLSIDDLSKLPAVTVKIKDREKQKHRYRGVPLHELLRMAGATLGEHLRGESLAKYVLVQAADGYEVLFSLAEIDPAMTDKVVVLAYEVDGAPLPVGQGPFRLVAPGEKRQARWIREIRSIRVEFHK